MTSDDDVLDRAEVDALYALDPHEFVSARDSLAKELKAEGDAAAARIVKALKRPTKVAWALNQVAREHGDAVAALLEAGTRVRDRQADALSGGDAGALREAAAERRDRLSAVLALVVALGGDGVREDAAGSLDAASVDPDAGDALAVGRLTTAIPRSSDLGFGGMPDPPPRTTSAPQRPTRTKSSAADRPAPVSDARPPAPVRLDRRRIDKLERELRRAERDAAAADDDLADAERRLRRAEEAVADATERAEAMAEALTDARRASDEANDAVERARRELDETSGR